MIVRGLEGFLVSTTVDLEACRTLSKLQDVGVEQRLDALLRHSRVELSLVVFEKPRELAAPVGKSHAVLLCQHQRSFDGAVSTSHHQDVLVLVVARSVKAVINPLAFLTFHAELARITSLPRGEYDPARAIFTLAADDPEGPVLLALE